MLKVDLHTHTIASPDGIHTVMETLYYAKKKGVELLAITDHGPQSGRRVNTVFFKRFQNPYDDIELLKGLECNLGNDLGEIDLPQSLLAQMDIVLLGIHKNTTRNKPKEFYTECLVQAIKANPCINIITHPNDPDFPVDYEILAKTALNHDVAIEINNSKTAGKIASPDSTIKLLRACMNIGCSIAVNSDAHVISELGQDNAVTPYLKELDFPEDLVITNNKERALKFINKKRV